MEKQRTLLGKRGFKLNFAALLSILALLVISYCVTNANANDDVSALEHPFDVSDFFSDAEDASTIKKNGAKSGKKNIIMMVTDGTGPSSFNMARSYKQHVQNLAYNETLTIEKYLIGQSRTRSSSSLITDSAAGATAFSCGLKSYNGAIGVDEFQNPCGTILEALKLKGYKTGMVVTTSVVDATPAAFSSHADYRNMLDLIANQQLGLNNTFGKPMVDLMIGGGRCSFLPSSAGTESCRNDQMDLVQYAKDHGYTVSLNREEFDLLQLGKNDTVQLPVLSLLAYYNIPYEIDRNEQKFPSLLEETKTALNLLSKATEDSDEGFFLLVEGSRIDHAGHHNDAHAQVREVLAYDEAFAEVIRFAEESDVETFIISTSDHETGGVDIGRQIDVEYPDYVWYPDVLARAKHSGEYLNYKIDEYLKSIKEEINKNKEDCVLSGKGRMEKLKKFLKHEILEKDLGISDYEEDEVKLIMKLLFKSSGDENDASLAVVEELCADSDVAIEEVSPASIVIEFLKDMVSKRARIGWSTHGHTAADVNIFGYSNSDSGMLELVRSLGGSRENTDIGAFMERIAGVSLGAVTELLGEQVHSPWSQ